MFHKQNVCLQFINVDIQNNTTMSTVMITNFQSELFNQLAPAYQCKIMLNTMKLVLVTISGFLIIKISNVDGI